GEGVRTVAAAGFAGVRYGGHAAHHAADAARLMAVDPPRGKRGGTDARAGARRTTQDQTPREGKRSAEPRFQYASAAAEGPRRAKRQIAGADRAAGPNAGARAGACAGGRRPSP